MMGLVIRRWFLPLGATIVCALAVGAVVVQGVASPAIAAPPAGPSQADIDNYVQRMLDETWINTGLSGELEQPPAVDVPPLSDDLWGDAFYACMAGLGYDLVSYSWSDGGGYQLSDANGQRVDDPDQQLAFYDCVSRNPRDPSSSGELVTLAGLEYAYDYYLRWTIPCIRAQGYTFDLMFERNEFVGDGTQNPGWSPYYSVPDLADPADFERLRAVCGPISLAQSPG